MMSVFIYNSKFAWSGHGPRRNEFVDRIDSHAFAPALEAGGRRKKGRTLHFRPVPSGSGSVQSVCGGAWRFRKETGLKSYFYIFISFLFFSVFLKRLPDISSNVSLCTHARTHVGLSACLPVSST